MNSSDAAMSDSEDMFGLDWMVKFAKLAQDELTMKNRIMVWMMVALSISLGFNVVLYNKVPDPKVLSTTTDGKYRPIPTLDEPIYNQKQIMSWAEKCVSTIYDLNYNSWNRQIQNNTECLSDNARAGFAKSNPGIGTPFVVFETPKDGIEVIGGVPISDDWDVLRTKPVTPPTLKLQ